MRTSTVEAREGTLDPAREPTMNNVELVGYIGSAPELRYTQDEVPFVRFSLATHRWRELDGAMQQLTDWHAAVGYGKKLCERGARLRIGELVLVAGWLHTWSRTDRTGGRRQQTEVVATRIERATIRHRQSALPLSVATPA